METGDNSPRPWRVKVALKEGVIINSRRVKLSREQHKPREQFLGPWQEDGWFDANNLQLKRGEEITIMARPVIVPEGLSLAHFAVIG